MAGLPNINIELTDTIYGLPTQGNLIYKYSPFQNLQNINISSVDDIGLTDLRMKVSEANINTESPLIVNIEKAYDKSVNLIISDKVNPLKLVNSRFYLTSSSTYNIADRRGNLDTNIYTKENFPIEAGLIKTVRTIVGLDFEGVEEGGTLPVGNYNFYFKLSDYDGNESDIIAESGQVVCYIGAINKPNSVRGGQVNENSNKLIKFKLNNLDLAYDYINIYYVRNTGDNAVESKDVYKIQNRFKILGSSTQISITGYEEVEKISLADINIKYATFNSGKAVASCQNMIFAGNITNNYELFDLLEKYSLRIVPTLTDEENIGNLNSKYEDFGTTANEYYNPNNIYYRLGYWDEEIYRLGIVYILNDYTLSPVFNIRGKKEIDKEENPFVFMYSDIPIDSEIKFNDNYIIEGGNDENTKGVFKIDFSGDMFNYLEKIKPIGIKLNFHNSILSGVGLNYPSINKLTKGFFIVRQKRIPNILAQALSIGSTIKGNIPVIKASTSKGSTYFTESFLTKDDKNLPILGRSIYGLNDSLVKNNALLCLEANLRSDIFPSLFNSSIFKLKKAKYTPIADNKFVKLDTEDKLFGISGLKKETQERTEIDTDLLLVNSETSLINNKNEFFSSVAGNNLEAWKYIDPINGNIEDFSGSISDVELSRDIRKTRGIFNSYLSSSKNLSDGSCKYYNIYNKDYNFNNWIEYFKIRYNDSSPFFPISDRIEWPKSFESSYTKSCYRGDCYINTVSQRILWNFSDPELPTNTRIVDKYTWLKNFKIKNIQIKINYNDFVVEDTYGEFIDNVQNIVNYKKILPLFTYRTTGNIVDDIDEGRDLNSVSIITPEAKKYSKYSESNGEFGYNKLNRPDINAVPLGHWVTYKVCSNINLGLRDEDFSNPAEEAIYKRKRSFYPYSSADLNSKLPESSIINKGISNSLGSKYYFEIPEVPFIETNFVNRIYHSNLLIESLFKDGSRLFKYDNYTDYTLEHGALIKLVEWYGTLIAVMEHGVLMIPVNERALMGNASGEDIYVNTDKVLPKNPKVLSNTFGSFWSESIVKTPNFIYGIDTVAKKIWRTNGDKFELISDMKIQKFLNDNIKLKVTDRNESIDYNLIKAHYNAFKSDVIFTYKYSLDKWSLCWNELQNTWVSRYSWFPEFSENINNIFYTFANKSEHEASSGKLFKHGFAGPLDERTYIKPTVWYNQQHPFEFEFVVIGIQGIQKIFDNLKIISNKCEPNSFTYEIVGESYDWYKYKEVISWMQNHSSFNVGEQTEGVEFSISEDGYYLIESISPDYYVDGYTYLLTHTIDQIETDYPDFPTPFDMSGTDMFKKLPYIPKIKSSSILDEIDWNLINYTTALINDQWNGEDRILSYQEAKSFLKFGRLRGNMHYSEDSWDIQIQPLTFRYAFMNGSVLSFSKQIESEIRDKYLKIRVKYDGTKLAIINSIKTLFTLSYT